MTDDLVRVILFHEGISALRVFKNPEVTSTVEFLFSEAGTSGFSTELF